MTPKQIITRLKSKKDLMRRYSVKSISLLDQSQGMRQIVIAMLICWWNFTQMQWSACFNFPDSVRNLATFCNAT